MSRIALVLGDMLFDGLPGLPGEIPVFMQEDMGLAGRIRYHQHKITLFFSAMRHFADRLGSRVHYVRLDEGNGQPLLENLARFCREQGATEVHTYEPHDRFFRRELEEWSERENMPVILHRSPGFLTSAEEWKRAHGKNRRRFMASFYTWQRRRLGILVQDDQPEGGKWSFDTENRRPLPAERAPEPVWVKPDAITREVIDLVKCRFSDHPGDAATFDIPVTHEGARAWLTCFLDERFADFGPFEDAISAEQDVLWHARITPFLNTGLLTPAEVVDAALARYRQGQAPLASTEGFVRQIIGWREFIRGIDRDYGERKMVARSPFGNDRELAPSWYEGTTGLDPLDRTIRRARDHAWTHHIERLMVAGAAMLMSGISPGAAYRWFMEMYIDSADWVMAPNVFGMSQFSDGPMFATKPYLSGSAYLRKMSNYPHGAWCDVWDGLYWRFIDRNRDYLARNARMGQIVGGVDRLKPDRRDKIFAAAERFIAEHTLPPG